jgi:hypothetical protein
MTKREVIKVVLDKKRPPYVPLENMLAFIEVVQQQPGYVPCKWTLL